MTKWSWWSLNTEQVSLYIQPSYVYYGPSIIIIIQLYSYNYVSVLSDTDTNSDSGILSGKTWTRTLSTTEKESDSGILDGMLYLHVYRSFSLTSLANPVAMDGLGIRQDDCTHAFSLIFTVSQKIFSRHLHYVFYKMDSHLKLMTMPIKAIHIHPHNHNPVLSSIGSYKLNTEQQHYTLPTFYF